jgi:cytochrome c oxidase cbb3-type subunit 2
LERGITLFLGVFLTFASAWFGLVFLPYLQDARWQPQVDEVDKSEYPRPRTGPAAHGVRVYAGNGCYYCHSQQVRPDGFGSDLQRGWGVRRSVPRDYLYDKPVMLGTMRTGPDLANIGRRQPSEDWHHLHLFNPRITSPGSVMPAFAFLYEERALGGERQLLTTDPFRSVSYNALKLPLEWAVRKDRILYPSSDPDGLRAYLNANPDRAKLPAYEVVPTGDATDLVAYLKSLDQSTPLKEAGD